MFEKKAQALPRKSANQEVAPDSDSDFEPLDFPPKRPREMANPNQNWIREKEDGSGGIYDLAERDKLNVEALMGLRPGKSPGIGARAPPHGRRDRVEDIDLLLEKIRELPEKDVRLTNEEIKELIKAISYMPDDWVNYNMADRIELGKITGYQ
ncbi:MAG: hypothetical protein Q8P20_00645 [bacterium]|nr:hypothetical protein [bacterium]